MTAKEYLSQAYQLDQRINSKVAQVDALNALARKVNSTITGMPRGSDYASSTMEEVVTKIIDLQAEINSDIDQLVDLKREMVQVIRGVKDKEYQTLLELRFLNGDSWEEIATKMGYSIQHTYRMRGYALSKVQVPLKWRVKES